MWLYNEKNSEVLINSDKCAHICMCDDFKLGINNAIQFRVDSDDQHCFFWSFETARERNQIWRELICLLKSQHVGNLC